MQINVTLDVTVLLASLGEWVSSGDPLSRRAMDGPIHVSSCHDQYSPGLAVHAEP